MRNARKATAVWQRSGCGVRGKTDLTPTQVADAMQKEATPPRIELGVLDPSIVPTQHFQKSLLRLPIPKLEDTCASYLKSVQPLLAESEFETTKKAVNSFLTGEGKGLQDKLVAKDNMNKHTSYISADWFDMYLSARTPLPVNWNPFLVFKFDPVPERNTQAFRAASFIHTSLRFKKAYDSGVLPPEVFHLKPRITKNPMFQRFVSMVPEFCSSYVEMAGQGFPLDMSQFANLFNSTRIPQMMKDELRVGRGNHVVCFFKGHPFKINVVDENGDPIDVNQIAARIQQLTYDTPLEQAEYPVGALTSTDRTTWARLREEMELDEANKRSLADIDNALFVVCLDDEVVDFTTAEAIQGMGRWSLHGDPQKSNRWWDKSFSLYVTRNGEACCNFEHAWGDGVAVMRWCTDVYHASSESRALPKQVPSTEKAQQLHFNLSDSVKNGIKSSISRLQGNVDSLKYHVSVYPDIGKTGLKKLKLSPDAFMQQSFQLGWKKLYNETRSTYESASTAAFKHGRTEAIRVATIESKAFCDAMVNPAASPTTRYELMIRAMEEHSNITKKCLMGKGTDRHLFALRKVAERSGDGKLPDIFTDPAYARLGESIISTSTLFADCFKLGGFGPVHDDGVGVGYAPATQLLFMGVTGYTRSPEDFSNAVWEGVDEMLWLARNQQK